MSNNVTKNRYKMIFSGPRYVALLKEQMNDKKVTASKSS